MKKKLKIKKIVPFILIIICLVSLIFSVINIFKWSKDSNKIKNQITDIQDSTIINEVDVADAEIISNETLDKSNPYYDYIKMNLISVDFDNLIKTNNQTAGWIQVSGTNINYPFVQGTDNKFYLTHMFDKSYNGGGWVFLDYRNFINESDKNTIIYAHGRKDTTMFGTLKNILKSGWLDNSDNYVVKLSTQSEDTLWQVFSVYRIPTTSDYLQIDFANDEEFTSFSNTLINRSNFNFNTAVNAEDKILTLSTCYNNSDKVVLHAKLIKKVNRTD